VQTAAFVTDSDGTGIVHCAPGFGEDDYNMCVEKKLIEPDDPPVPLDDNGRFTKEVPAFEGMYIKNADEIIMKDLK
jgi:isoleucyl-tRNA synthetase